MSNTATAYPLQWPHGWPRTPAGKRRKSPYSGTFTRGYSDLRGALNRFGAVEVVVSTCIELRRDGAPYAPTREPDDVGVAVYFRKGARPVVIACDTYQTVTANMRACWATIEALRTIERNGTTELLDRAFLGFKALPAQGASEAWWVVLGVERDADADAVQRAYKAQAMTAHPDRGGSVEVMTRLNVAIAAFKDERHLQ